MLSWIITEAEDNILLRDFLRNHQHFSRRTLQAIKFSGGKIKVNGVQQKVTYRLRKGDLIEVHFPSEKKGNYMFAQALPLDIVYEDDYIIVLNKKAGMVASPNPLHPSGTIANGLLYYYEQKNYDKTVHIVTRLDRDTSGLMLIAKNQHIHSLFQRAQMKQKIIRNYKAIVHGKVKQKQGVIQAKIGREEGSIIKRQVTDDGKHAITHYDVLCRTKSYSFVNVFLETGRTHQIRVHFAYIGHPLMGDTLYGSENQPLPIRQALHCSRLCFKHPIFKKRMSFHSEIPKDMAALLQ